MLERNLPQVDSNCSARTQPLTSLVRVRDRELAESAQWVRTAAPHSPPLHHRRGSGCVPRPGPAPGPSCRATQIPSPRPGVPPAGGSGAVLPLLCGLSLRKVWKLPLSLPKGPHGGARWGERGASQATLQGTRHVGRPWGTVPSQEPCLDDEDRTAPLSPVHSKSHE